MSGPDRVPLHLQDQADAAERQAAEVLAVSAAALDTEIVIHRDHQGDDVFLDEMLDRIRAVARAGRLTACPHTRSPQPLLLNYWDDPWVCRCGRCSSEQPALSEREQNTCDRCGRYDPTGLWPTQILLGAILVTMGRCDNCIPKDKRPNSSR